jgi:hypothetical protein
MSSNIPLAVLTHDHVQFSGYRRGMHISAFTPVAAKLPWKVTACQFKNKAVMVHFYRGKGPTYESFSAHVTPSKPYNFKPRKARKSK